MIINSDIIHTQLVIYHVLIALITILGGYFISIHYIPLYLIILPFMFLDWNDIGYKCFFTLLTNSVKKNNNNNNEFIPDLFKKLNLKIKSYYINIILSFLVFLSWLIGYIRLINYYDIKLFPNNYSKIFLIIFLIFWLLIIIKIKRKNIKLFI